MQEQKYSIKYWAKDDQPREKLLSKHPVSLSDSELIAILLKCGARNRTAVDLGREVLQLGRGNLQELGKLTVNDVMKVRGIGKVKAITLLAALELGRRRHASISLRKMVITDSHDIANYLQIVLQDRQREVFGVVFLNKANRINHFEILSEGGITGTVADPRVILKKALESDAVSLILCHNHPSGNLKPSRADRELTAKIKEAAHFFDIHILDHIIVGDDGYFSFADEGVL
jgi:DNA repair protein RadC